VTEPLTNGMLELERSIDLTKLESWEVQFSNYVDKSQKPIVVMAPGASLDDVERVARQAMIAILARTYVSFGRSSSDSSGFAQATQTVASASVTNVRRVGPVYLDPRVA
jgi:hypothetical protein